MDCAKYYVILLVLICIAPNDWLSFAVFFSISWTMLIIDAVSVPVGRAVTPMSRFWGLVTIYREARSRGPQGSQCLRGC